MKKQGLVRNEKGFTLIEIIAVLVVLGILAMVAVPKYMSLQNDAGKKAAVGAVAEGKSRVNLYAAKELLASGSVNSADFTAANLSAAAGDFTLSYTANSSGVDVSAVATGNAAYTASDTVAFPVTTQ